MSDTIRAADLDHTARELREARDHAMKVLVLCSGYVEQRAIEGDLRAKALAHLVQSAQDSMTLAGIQATTVKSWYE